jgi:cysteinyl-tRNA synthetase
MKLYNTLTRTVSDFTPHQDNQVSLYTCGPTVYDYAHIGNLRKFIFDDTLRRVLAGAHYRVKHVMNITDVGHLVSDADEGEDKLEKGAQREGVSAWDIAKRYTDAFKRDVGLLNILAPNGYDGSPDHYARATDFIDQQIDMVARLVERGYAYQTKQAIYFDVTKLDDYGKLSGQKLSDKEIGVRDEVVSDPDKRHPFDFAVWFFTVGHFANHEMHWKSPWGEGFPGWHLECSAIIHATLGEPIDIHTGGVDHIGTHHTNEMAQTEGAFGCELADYWLHSDFILVDGGKMSKSKGNFYTLQDIIDRGYEPLAYRLLVLQAHYRSELNFTWDSLDGAQTRLKDFRAMADLRWQVREGDEYLGPDYQAYQHDLQSALEDDLNTPRALAIISGAEAGSTMPIVATANIVEEFLAFLKYIDDTLGLRLLSSEDINQEQKDIIRRRETARADRDWSTSDQLRDALVAQHIGLRDTAQGTIWFRL